MKKGLLVLALFISYMSFSQNNYIVKTEDGRRVLLKADFTWEYIDLEKPAEASIAQSIPDTTHINRRCDVSKDFVEPELDKKNQSRLKKGRATIKHVKKKVAKDYNCDINQVLLLSVKEQKQEIFITSVPMVQK